MLTWSWKITSAAGIGIFAHWTLVFLIVWVGVHDLLAGAPALVAIEGIVLLLAAFGCIVLHELGHALTARRFGVATRDITLWPIGGVARLERVPERPMHELLVALAGPAVNLAVASILALALFVGHGMASASGFASAAPGELLLDLGFVSNSLLARLFYLNIALALFNLLPAFPMDGGRVVRALLATRLDYLRATEIAASIGQAMALVLAGIGLLYNWFLLLIAIFVYFGARHEASQARHRRTPGGADAGPGTDRDWQECTIYDDDDRQYRRHRDRKMAELVSVLHAGDDRVGEGLGVGLAAEIAGAGGVVGQGGVDALAHPVGGVALIDVIE